jgi:hypothetical protein
MHSYKCIDFNHTPFISIPPQVQIHILHLPTSSSSSSSSPSSSSSIPRFSNPRTQHIVDFAFFLHSQYTYGLGICKPIESPEVHYTIEQSIDKLKRQTHKYCSMLADKHPRKRKLLGIQYQNPICGVLCVIRIRFPQRKLVQANT